MKLMVISDIHGHKRNLLTAAEYSKNSDMVISLGDTGRCEELIEELFSNKKLVMITGNCDHNPTLPVSYEDEICGKKLFACHGHLYKVKYDMAGLMAVASAKKSDLVLFGHTHGAVDLFEDNIHYVNPGSLSGSGKASFALIDIVPSGILVNHIYI